MCEMVKEYIATSTCRQRTTDPKDWCNECRSQAFNEESFGRKHA